MGMGVNRIEQVLFLGVNGGLWSCVWPLLYVPWTNCCTVYSTHAFFFFFFFPTTHVHSSKQMTPLMYSIDSTLVNYSKCATKQYLHVFNAHGSWRNLEESFVFISPPQFGSPKSSVEEFTRLRRRRRFVFITLLLPSPPTRLSLRHTCL